MGVKVLLSKATTTPTVVGMANGVRRVIDDDGDVLVGERKWSVFLFYELAWDREWRRAGYIDEEVVCRLHFHLALELAR